MAPRITYNRCVGTIQPCGEVLPGRVVVGDLSPSTFHVSWRSFSEPLAFTGSQEPEMACEPAGPLATLVYTFLMVMGADLTLHV